MKCKNCGKIFEKAVKHQKFCRDGCRSLYWFKHNRRKWNDYMRNWKSNDRLRKFAKKLRDFKPEDNDFRDFEEF